MNKEITVVCVSNVHHDLVEQAFQKTLENTPYVKDTILFSNKPIKNVNTFIKLKNNFDYLDYNYFVLKTLDFFIKTDYVLIIQPDSMAVNKSVWTDNFFFMITLVLLQSLKEYTMVDLLLEVKNF